jgi:hypothetical protein
MPAEAPVCARTGLVLKAPDKPTAAAVAMASARDAGFRNAGFRNAGFNGCILLGVLATIIWDKYQSRRHGTEPLAKLWLQPLTVNLGPVNLRSGQLEPRQLDAGQIKSQSTCGQRVCKRSRGSEKPENAAAPGRARGGSTIRQGN